MKNTGTQERICILKWGMLPGETYKKLLGIYKMIYV